MQLSDSQNSLQDPQPTLTSQSEFFTAFCSLGDDINQSLRKNAHDNSFRTTSAASAHSPQSSDSGGARASPVIQSNPGVKQRGEAGVDQDPRGGTGLGLHNTHRTDKNLDFRCGSLDLTTTTIPRSLESGSGGTVPAGPLGGPLLEEGERPGARPRPPPPERPEERGGGSALERRLAELERTRDLLNRNMADDAVDSDVEAGQYTSRVRVCVCVCVCVGVSVSVCV